MAGKILLLFFLLNLNAQQRDAFENSRLNFLYEKDERGQRGLITFNSKWDWKDAKRFYMLPFSFYKSAERMDLAKDVKFKYYGYNLKPFKIININALRSKKNISGVKEEVRDGESDSSEISSQNSTASSKKRKFISLSPLYDDLKENFDDFILENSLKHLNPQWSSVSKEGKKEFFKDLSSTGIFDNSLLSPLGNEVEKISGNK
ncbi:MAG: hypothetical protein GX447_04220 [Elusimicrobia bacterium]|nr:hypothetical protein [Elusimicrobiota bacterium]